METQTYIHNISSKKLPKLLYSYDYKEYVLREGKRLRSGFFASYESLYHYDMTATGCIIEDCREKLAIKMNQLITLGLVLKAAKSASSEN